MYSDPTQYNSQYKVDLRVSRYHYDELGYFILCWALEASLLSTELWSGLPLETLKNGVVSGNE